MKGRMLLVVCVSVVIGFCACLLFVPRGMMPAEADCRDEPCDSPPCCNGDVNGDGTIDIADPTYLLAYLFAGGLEAVELPCGLPCPSGELPATGQTTCSDDGRPANAITCETSEFPGQDAFYQAGCPIEGRFIDNGDGTVTDTCTGLTWQQATAPGLYRWAEALRYCESLVIAGHDDWRLPNVRELQSIVDYGRSYPAIDPVFQCEGGGQTPFYWSSSSFVANPQSVWTVSFQNGRVGNSIKVNLVLVRAVRG